MVRKVSTKKSKKIKENNNETLVLNCTACDIPQLLVQGKRNILCHSTLHVAICRECLMFSNCDIVPLDDEGYEIYCRWCSELGDLVCCDRCKAPYCKECIVRNFDEDHYNNITEQEDWSCYSCDPTPIKNLRIVTKAALNFQNFMEPSDILLERCVRKFNGEEITDSDREEIIRERIKLRRNAMAKVEIQRNEAKESDEGEEENSDNKSVNSEVEVPKGVKKSDNKENSDNEVDIAKRVKKSDNEEENSDDKSVESEDEVSKDVEKSDNKENSDDEINVPKHRKKSDKKKKNSDDKSVESEDEVSKDVEKSDKGTDKEEDEEEEESEDASTKKRSESRKRLKDSEESSKEEESDDEKLSERVKSSKSSTTNKRKSGSATSVKRKKKKSRY